MKLSSIFLSALIGAVVALGAMQFLPAPSGAPAAQKETAFERVMRTGTIRCGYASLPEYTEKDIQTGKLKGLYFDIIEEMGRQLSLKIDWAEEVGFANAFDGLKTGRYDVLCIPFSQAPGRARVTSFTVPIIFAPYYAFVRADDGRFDADINAANDPSVTMTVLEGELSQIVKNEQFPKAKELAMPNMTDVTQVLLQVQMGKADMAMTEPRAADLFEAQNPGKVRRVAGPPLRMLPEGLSVAVGEVALKDMLNTTIEALHTTGFMQRVFAKYPETTKYLILPAKPWDEKTR